MHTSPHTLHTHTYSTTYPLHHTPPKHSTTNLLHHIHTPPFHSIHPPSHSPFHHTLYTVPHFTSLRHTPTLTYTLARSTSLQPLHHPSVHHSTTLPRLTPAPTAIWPNMYAYFRLNCIRISRDHRHKEETSAAFLGKLRISAENLKFFRARAEARARKIFLLILDEILGESGNTLLAKHRHAHIPPHRSVRTSETQFIPPSRRPLLSKIKTSHPPVVTRT